MGADKYVNKLYLQTDLICAQGGLKGPKKVRQTPWTFGRGHGASIEHTRRDDLPLSEQLSTLFVHRPGLKRLGGGSFKANWSVHMVVPTASDLRRVYTGRS